MRYEIKGTPFPVVICQLENGEQMVTERGSMVWMSPNMERQTHGGGLGRMFSKMFSGESMFQNIYTAHGAGMIAFGSSFPGQIKEIAITPGHDMILQKSAFLAAVPGVELSIHFNQRLGAGLFGGEGFIMQRLSGSGMAFAEIDGTSCWAARALSTLSSPVPDVSGCRPCPSPAWPPPCCPISPPATIKLSVRPAESFFAGLANFYFSRNKTASPRITGMTGDKSL